MEFVELLAPAKDLKTAISAIKSGCDAVYIGAESFGARQNASNNLDDIKVLVEYAHKFYVKVHVTINTILTDSELVSAVELIKKLYEIGVDAIIVQDMGILEKAISGELPPIPIHISTQADNRTLEKVQFFDKLGVSRVILARELSQEKIREICQNTKCEIETFVHGALCVSYSGQCYLSCAIGGRSANRGECAQSCRKKYSLVTSDGKFIAKDKYLLSMKDFNASKHLENLVKSGVKSFKIEGRLKDENYVKNVVAYYRKELDKVAEKTSSGEIFSDFEPDVKKSFNRGFTDYFLEKRKDCFNFDTPKSQGEEIGKVTKVGGNYFEINADLHSQDGLCWFKDGEIYGCLVNKVEGRKVYPNKSVNLQVGTKIYRNFNCEFEKRLTNSKTRRQIGVDISVKNGSITLIDEDKNTLISKIPSGELPKSPDKMNENFIKHFQKTGDSDFYVKTIEINDNLPFLPISEINKLRRDLFDELMQIRLKNYPREIQKPLKYAYFSVKILDYRANVHNLNAKKFWESCGCKVSEMSFESQKPKTAELMRTKHCLKFAFNMCKSKEELFLIDEKGKKYPLKFDCRNCEMVVLGNF